MFGEEQKILEMFILNVAEPHGGKGLATRLVKVGTMTCYLALTNSIYIGVT